MSFATSFLATVALSELLLSSFDGMLSKRENFNGRWWPYTHVEVMCDVCLNEL
jgi:hypothetical protein